MAEEFQLAKGWPCCLWRRERGEPWLGLLGHESRWGTSLPNSVFTGIRSVA